MPEIDFKTIKSGVDEIGKSFEEFKSTHEKSLKEKDTLLETKLSKITEDITKRHEEVTKGIAALEARFNRPELAVDPSSKELVKNWESMKFIGRCTKGPGSALANISFDEYTEYRQHYSKWLRASFSSEVEGLVRKSMSVGSDPDGGYWITPPEIDSKIRTRIFETSPMRQLATVQNISTHEYKVQEDPNELSAGWVAETAARLSTNTPKVATKVITANEIYAQPQVTRTLLEDAAVDIEAWLTWKVADKFARVENTTFLFGTGVGQPRGLCTYPAQTSGDASNNLWGQIGQVLSGATGTFAYTSLLSLITSIKDNYQANASFLVLRQNLAAIMGLQDGNGRYIFMPVLNGSFNETPLFGYPLRYAHDLQAVGTSGNILMAFGDFRQAYMIVDRIGTSVIRDEITNKPFILYYTRQRVGGDVVDYDAAKLYVAS